MGCFAIHFSREQLVIFKMAAWERVVRLCKSLFEQAVEHQLATVKKKKEEKFGPMGNMDMHIWCNRCSKICFWGQVLNSNIHIRVTPAPPSLSLSHLLVCLIIKLCSICGSLNSDNKNEDFFFASFFFIFLFFRFNNSFSWIFFFNLLIVLLNSILLF